MTETASEVTAAEAAPAGPQKVDCAHCGASNTVDVEATPDWQCAKCERYQDSAVCPTCHSVVRASLMGGAN